MWQALQLYVEWSSATTEVTARVLAALVPQLLPAVTVILPFWPAAPDVTVSLFVPCPAVMVHPEGTVHVYVVALATVLTLYS
jgi:hypothetical protein